MNVMNTGVGSARVGEWYVRWDNGELFQVMGHHPERHASSIENFQGELYEIDDQTWSVLPLTLVEPPDDPTMDLQAEGVAQAESAEAVEKRAAQVAEEAQVAEDETSERVAEAEPAEQMTEALEEELEWPSPVEQVEVEEFASPDGRLRFHGPGARPPLR
jgi:hypothetical protein